MGGGDADEHAMKRPQDTAEHESAQIARSGARTITD